MLHEINPSVAIHAKYASSSRSSRAAQRHQAIVPAVAQEIGTHPVRAALRR
jgi:hypothetical protein